ncbi:MAG: hypothetical protein DRJ60_02410 [Thermoprotei archaeon]|nr:MAG: hypothetical protein DRJ60_02410 [Thermoprotei archaeon]
MANIDMRVLRAFDNSFFHSLKLLSYVYDKTPQSLNVLEGFCFSWARAWLYALDAQISMSHYVVA